MICSKRAIIVIFIVPVLFLMPEAMGQSLHSGRQPVSRAIRRQKTQMSSEVMTRCRRAYARLHSCRLAITAHVRPVFEMDSPFGLDRSQTIQAVIRYVSPDYLHLDGYVVSSYGPVKRFKLFCCRGTSLVTVWSGKKLLDSSRYREPMLGIAALTGITSEVGSIFPAILLRSRAWAYPDALRHSIPGGTVSDVIFEGRSCYRVAYGKSIGETYWIDKKTCLILKYDNGIVSQTVMDM